MAECLSPRSQERIAKLSTDRLRSQLVRSGVDEGEVVRMESTELTSLAVQF